MRCQLEVHPTPEVLALAAARRIAAWANAAVAARGAFTFVLSGGRTPVLLYTYLAAPPFRERVPWPQAHIFWGDERCVPPEHPDSNYRLARHTLLDHVPVPPAQVHRIPGERPPEEAATAYETTLRQCFPGEPAPRFDLVLLGLGDDGHTASLFPGTSSSWRRDRWVVALDGGPSRSWRVSLTPWAVNGARNVLFLVSGKAKAHALKQVLQARLDPDAFPAQAICPEDGDLLWLVDAEAASLLEV
jgi:6-phosphogluconolactonase